MIRAAGGVVLRGEGDAREVVVIHRERHDDWSLPKGKLEPGETLEQAALREVEEETGLRCRLLAFLGHTRYPTAGGRKEVSFWLMEPLDDTGFRPEHEVDAVRWLPLADLRLLTYDRERALLTSLL